MKKVLLLLSCCLLQHTLCADSKTAQNIHRYIWANYNQFGGKVAAAQQWYNKLLTSHASVYMYKGYVTLLFQTGQFQKIVQLIPQLDTTFSDDPKVQLMFALALAKTNNQHAANERLIKINDQFKSNQEIAFYTANVYLSRKEPKNALIVIDNLLNSSARKPTNFIFHFLKSQIYVQINNKPKALESVKRSLDMQPKFDKGWLLYALLKEEIGNLDDAINGYTTFLELTGGSNKQVAKHLLGLVIKQKVLQQGNKPLIMSASCFEKALMLYEQKEYSQALKQIDACLKEKPNDTDSKLLKIQILSSMNNYTQAIDLLVSWIHNEPTNHMWYTTLHLLSRTRMKEDQVIKAFERIATKQPTNILPMLYAADLYIRTHNTTAALPALKKAHTLTHDTSLKTKILFQMGIIYYDNQQFDSMKSVCQEGKKLNTNFPPLLNLLAYYYAGKGKNITEAQKLIDTVLTTDKNNPHFLDTQAYIFYKQHNYDKALNILHSIAPKAPHDTTILTHLSKTHFKQGNIKKALDTLEQAVKITKSAQEKKKLEQLQTRWNIQQP